MRLAAWLTCLSGLLGAGASGWPQGGRNLLAERSCCKRQRRLVYLGQGEHKTPVKGWLRRTGTWNPCRLKCRDLSGSPVTVDVGVCRSLCGRGSSPAPGYPGLPRQPSVLDFHRTPKRQEGPSRLPAGSRGAPHSEGSCPPGSLCEPSRILVQDLLLRKGPRQLEVVQGCQCNASPDGCLRSPALKTFFPDSPMEQTVDVGRCAAPPPSEGGPSCRPTRFDAVLLKGPNGSRAVWALGGCQWQEASCYRVPHWEHHLEVVTDAAGKKLEQRKEIDVGRCLGRCGSGSRCPLRDPGRPGTSCGGARAAARHCIPHHYEMTTFQSRTGQLRTIFAIRTCKCGSEGSGAAIPTHLWSEKK